MTKHSISNSPKRFFQIVLRYCIGIIVLQVLFSAEAQAQSSSLDFLRSTGKIYAVVALICSIFLGIVIYLIRIERKLNKLENQITNESKTA